MAEPPIGSLSVSSGFPQQGKMLAMHAGRGGGAQSAVYPRKSTVKIGGRQQTAPDGMAPNATGFHSIRNAHQFVMDLNKRTPTKSPGLPLDPSLPGFPASNRHHQNGSNSDRALINLIGFSGLAQDVSSTISESPTMSLIRESLGPSECPSLELDCLFMASLNAACQRHKDNARYAETLAKSQLLQGRDLLDTEWPAVWRSVQSLLGMFAAQWKHLSELECEEALVHPLGIERAIQKEVQTQKLEVKEKALRRCQALVSVATASLANASSSSSSCVFYQRLLGTVYQFLCMFCSGIRAYQCEQLVIKHFKAALRIAEKDLSPYHPLRIEAVTSYVSFMYDQLGERDAAMEIARKAFSEATDKLEEVSEEDFNVVIRPLRTLLKLINWWSKKTKHVLISSGTF